MEGRFNPPAPLDLARIAVDMGEAARKDAQRLNSSFRELESRARKLLLPSTEAIFVIKSGPEAWARELMSKFGGS